VYRVSQAGALELEGSELRFETSADGRSQDVIRKEELPVMATVAEAMIAANNAVAQRIHDTFPQSALLRRHAPPRHEAFAEVNTRAHLALCTHPGPTLSL
jgi:exoribonuclease R